MERSFHPTVFTKNRKRLLEHKTGQALFDEVVWEADRRALQRGRDADRGSGQHQELPTER